MANYTFYDTKAKKTLNISMPISELDDFVAQNPHLEQQVTMPAITSGVSNRKPDAGFRDVLKRIKKASGRNNSINTW